MILRNFITALVLFVLFMLPQMSTCQTEYPNALSKEEIELQKKKMEQIVKELGKTNQLILEHPFRPKIQNRKSFPTIFIILFIISVLSMLTFISLTSSKQKDEEKPILNNKEEQVAAILEKKNFEKIVEEGLATTIIKVRCRSCNQLNEEGYKFCTQCGNKV